MKTLLKYLVLFLFAIVIGFLVGWFVHRVLGITSNTALNAIRGAWILGIFLGFLLGRNWKKWKKFWGLKK